jgi:hypothetical protein
VTITDIDMGWDAYVSGMEIVDGAMVEAGLLEPEQAQKGAWNELGTRTIPARPWMSIAGDTNVPVIFGVGAEAIGEIADGGVPYTALDKIGDTVVDLEREVLLSGMTGGPPLAPSTVRNKGSDVKLIDTEAMIDSLDHEVTL